MRKRKTYSKEFKEEAICLVQFVLYFFRKAMTIFARRCPADKCLCRSVCVCG